MPLSRMYRCQVSSLTSRGVNRHSMAIIDICSSDRKATRSISSGVISEPQASRRCSLARFRCRGMIRHQRCTIIRAVARFQSTGNIWNTIAASRRTR